MHAKLEINIKICALAATIAMLVGAASFVHAQTAGDPNANGTTGDPAAANANDPAASPTLSNNGILGCLGQGARVSNVGTTRAIGGVYVPVNDAAVTLNTGYLVYKECVLDGMARKVAENAVSELAQQQIRTFQQQNNQPGGYLTNFDAFFDPYQQQILANQARAIQSGQMCGAFRSRVATALVRAQYLSRGSTAAQACSMSDSARASVINRESRINWGEIVAFATDNEIMHFEDELARNQALQARFEQNTREMIMMGRGAIPIFDSSTNPLGMRVVTPGFLVADAISQAMGSGFRQLENANEIDQIVSNLFGGLTTRIVSGGSGIPGLFVSTGNQPAYIDRMIAQTRAAVRAGAVNAALVSLSGTRATEARYLAAKQTTGNAFLNTINELRGVENQCWNLIIPEVQAAAGSATLNIATSTQFSQQVIDSQIRATASTTAEEIRISQQTLAAIDQLIAQVTNSSSPAAQQQALVQIDQMVANGQLHSDQDVQTAESQRDSVTTALATLLSSTKTQWGDSTDPQVGWCNVSNNNPNKAQVVQRWLDAWN